MLFSTWALRLFHNIVTRKRFFYVLTHLLAAAASLQFGILAVAHRRSSSLPTQWRSINSLLEHYTALHFYNHTEQSSFFNRLVVEAFRVTRDDFISKFLLGCPLQPSIATNDEVLVLRLKKKTRKVGDALPLNSLKRVTSDCDIVNVVNVALSNTLGNEQTCLAIVGAKRSKGQHYDITKYVRKMTHRALSQNDVHLKLFGRYVMPTKSGEQLSIVPQSNITQSALYSLQHYLLVFEEVIESLRPIAEKVAISQSSPSTRGAVIVMVSNFGHIDLFINFCCAALAAGMDLSKILFFATDRDAKAVAESMGIATFYHDGVFASIPRNASTSFGSPLYAQIVSTKIYCVHLVSSLGYDILFQDVDIVPYDKSYLQYFVDAAKKEKYDFFFQNDHSSREVYLPWSANSGCYFVRSNTRTRYFFSSLALVGGDRLMKAVSHQAILHAALSHHASMYGLRIKTFNDKIERLPNGFYYYRRPDYMRDMILTNKTKVLSLHLNWNTRIVEKQHAFEQMGDWYVVKNCQDKTTDQIEKSIFTEASIFNEATDTKRWLLNTCCAHQPLIQCHYKDLPSIISCNGSPALKNYRESFW